MVKGVRWRASEHEMAVDVIQGLSGVAALVGARVLIVEDRGLIAAKIRRILERAGASPVGPALTIAEGFQLAESDESLPDAAVLDIDMKGRAVYPLAQRLLELQIPLVFLTGYSASALPEPWRGVPCLEKPFEASMLVNIVGLVLGSKVRPQDPGVAEEGQPLSDIGRRVHEACKEARNLITEHRILAEDMDRWQ
jgi:CheY-like chemotaxis protein